MGNQYGCTCSDNNSALVQDKSNRETEIILSRNRTLQSEPLIKTSRTNSNNLDRVNSFLKEFPMFKPSLTDQVKEVLNRLPSFERPYIDDPSLSIKGPIQYENKTVYVGYFNTKEEKEGYGILYFPDGGLYEGYFRNDKMNGKGRLINADGDYYEGDFENEKASKIGTYVSSEGVIYKGSWNEDKQHGYGEEVYLDGSKYEGNFDNGEKKGKGKFSWKDGSYYEGQFNKNVIDGKGTYHFKDNRVYKGEWKDNKMHGLGIFIWPDNKRYIGEYRNDKKEGFGIFIWPDGRRYEGGWHNGKQHGFGCMMINGIRKFGQWNYGNKIRWLDENNESDVEIINRIKYNTEKTLVKENIEM
jgi:hypothetical protein